MIKNLILIITTFIQSNKTNYELKKNQSRCHPNDDNEPLNNSKRNRKKQKCTKKKKRKQQKDAKKKEQDTNHQPQSTIFNADQCNNTDTSQTPFNADQRHGACSPKPENHDIENDTKKTFYLHIRTQSTIFNADQDNTQTPFNIDQHHSACSPKPENHDTEHKLPIKNHFTETNTKNNHVITK